MSSSTKYYQILFTLGFVGCIYQNCPCQDISSCNCFCSVTWHYFTKVGTAVHFPENRLVLGTRVLWIKITGLAPPELQDQEYNRGLTDPLHLGTIAFEPHQAERKPTPPVGTLNTYSGNQSDSARIHYWTCGWVNLQMPPAPWIEVFQL